MSHQGRWLDPVLRYMWRAPLKQLLLRTITTGIVVIAFLSSLITSLEGRVEIRSNLMDEGMHLTEKLADSSRFALLVKDEEAARRVLEPNAQFPNVQYVALLDAKGNIFASLNGTAGTSTRHTSVQLRSALSEEGFLHFEDSESWTFVAPVIRSERSNPFNLTEEKREFIGHALIVVSKQTLKRMQQRIFIINFAVSGALALILISIIRYIGAGITAPLVELSKTMREAGDGNVDVRANIDGPRDVAGMAKIFNKMITTLQMREEELQNAKNNLEILVAQRTEELQSANQMLAQLASARKDTLRHATHALRNPMQGLRSTLHVLLTNPDYPEDKRHRAVRRANISAETIHALIERYLRSEEIDSETFQVNISRTPIASILQHATESNCEAAAAKGINLDVESSDDLAIVTDERALGEIIDNLISNAIKYSHSGSTVNITVNSHDAATTISVLDRGIGVPEDSQGVLFTRFGKCLAPTAGEESSGLGLEISRKLSLKLGFELCYRCRPGGGSIFEIVIPSTAISIK